MSGLVEAIYIAATGGETMQFVEQVEALAERGLRGDRYCEHAGYWTGVDECQVTLIEAEALEDIEQTAGLRVKHGEHRRNLVTRGIRLAELWHKQFQIGAVILAYDRPRPPCNYLQTITQPGMTRALAGGRSGICARVIKGGLIRINDSIEVLGKIE